MPVYPHKCPTCRKVVDLHLRVVERDQPQACPDCQARLERVKVVDVFMDSWKEPLVLEHIAEKPMTFNSKSELRAECKKRKVTSSALL